jgi:ribonuclease VapC
VSISASNVIELDMLALRRAGAEGELLADALIDEFGIEVIPVDKGQIRVARNGFRLYGKGRHPAGLNYGDLFAYALSKITGEPLLFKGEDFSKTDVVAAL